MRSFSIIIVSLFVLVTGLTGCILVEDVSGAWDQAKIDPALEGGWIGEKQTDQDIPIYFTKEGDHYRGLTQYPQNPYKMIKTLYLGGATFMILKDSVGIKHMVYRYTIENGQLVLFAPDPKQKEDFISHYPQAQYDNRQGLIVFKNMGKENLEVLEKIAGYKSFWEETNRFVRLKAPRKEMISSQHQ